MATKGEGRRGKERIGYARGKGCLLLNGGLVTPLVWGSGVSKSCDFFAPKGTSLREPTSFEPFCVIIGRGV